MYRIVIDISLYVCVFTGGSEEVLLRKSKIKSDSGWQMSEEDQQMTGNIYSPQFFRPSAFSVPSQNPCSRDGVFPCGVRNEWLWLALSLSPSLSLTRSLSLSRERMSVYRLLTPPPLSFSFCHWHLLPPFVPCFVLTVQKYSCRFHLFLPPLCHMFACSYCLHNLRSFFLFLSNDR